jgi:hypothetical protein
MRRLTRGVLVALPLALALALTGCGSDDGGSDVASAGGGKEEPVAAGSPSLSRDEMGVKFAQCMRENGIDMADPEPGKGVMLKVGPEVGKETMDKAMEACREYNPMADGAAGADPQAEENGRKFAICMRENGVEAFPDPAPGQRGIKITPEIGQDPDFEKAQEKCQDILSGPAGGQ